MKSSQVAVLAALGAAATILSGCGNLKKKIVEKHVSPLAIDGFLDLKGGLGKAVDEYCTKDDKFTAASWPEKIWWPSCGLADKMDDLKLKSEGGKCEAKANGGCISFETMKAFDEFNTKYGGKKVSYKSRAGKTPEGKDIEVMDLTGWWMPAPNHKADTPRIVVQHGFSSNSNKFRTMFVAYLLRKKGYSVLVNNLRDHCYSADTKHKMVSWGNSYPMDTLGAWDFAKDHADAPIDASKVGVVGFSMGAFITLNAFGMEGKIPAAWVDGPPLTPKDGFEVGFKAALGKVATFITDDVWEDMKKEAKKKGIDLEAHLPEETMPKGPDTKRPIFVTANKQDDSVPFKSAARLVAEVLPTMKDKYALADFWALDGGCYAKDKDGKKEHGTAHCTDFLTHTEEYEEKLGKFWGAVFSGKKPEMGAERLYEQDAQVSELPPNSGLLLLGAAAFVVAMGLVGVVRRRRQDVSTEQASIDSEQELGVE